MNSYKRMPRGKWARKLEAVQQEAWDWKNVFEQRSEMTDSPALRERLFERSLACDELWHRLEDALDWVATAAWR